MLLFGVLLWLNFHSHRPSLRVLMYHKVDPLTPGPLTVTTEQLRQHITYLQTSGYQFVTLNQVLNSVASPAIALPRRSVLLTFDDGYENNLTYAVPILHELSVSATIFVPTAYVGQTNVWDEGTDALLTVEQLKGLSEAGIALAYHTHEHLNFKNETGARIRADLEQSHAEAERMGLPMAPAFSYSYGGRPKNPADRQLMRETMARLGIKLAFRIGNRINPLPLRDLYELNRIDVRGSESFARFRRKVKWGKLV